MEDRRWKMEDGERCFRAVLQLSWTHENSDDAGILPLARPGQILAAWPNVRGDGQWAAGLYNNQDWQTAA